MKRAAVYERSGVLFVRSSSTTTQGIWIEDGDCTTLPLAAESEAIGKAVKQALEASTRGVPHPSGNSWRLVVAPLLKASKVKTYGAFARLARRVSASLADVIALEPSRNDGARAGFHALAEGAERLPVGVSFSQLGEAVVRAIARSSIVK